ncbi:MAG: hypothetical protein CL674_02115 [Bdellovibrionaceae bacterium]|nr:hypothetical protein [Pseudobdellovibrionaceae bacterium]|tara:strand:+ start:415 stop:1248 length:834 start_codon:yes stop_codon:yes gene_type:complete
MLIRYIQLILFQAALIYLCNSGLANAMPRQGIQCINSMKTDLIQRISNTENLSLEEWNENSLFFKEDANVLLHHLFKRYDKDKKPGLRNIPPELRLKAIQLMVYLQAEKDIFDLRDLIQKIPDKTDNDILFIDRLSSSILQMIDEKHRLDLDTKQTAILEQLYLDTLMQNKNYRLFFNELGDRIIQIETQMPSITGGHFFIGSLSLKHTELLERRIHILKNSPKLEKYFISSKEELLDFLKEMKEFVSLHIVPTERSSRMRILNESIRQVLELKGIS